MGVMVKTQMENGLSKLFNFRGQNIDVSDQSVFTLNDSGLRDEEGQETNVSNPITAAQRRSGNFLSLMMKVHPYQADTNCKHSRMACRTCIQIILDLDGIDAIIDTHTIENP